MPEIIGLGEEGLLLMEQLASQVWPTKGLLAVTSEAIIGREEAEKIIAPDKLESLIRQAQMMINDEPSVAGVIIFFSK